MTVKSRIIQSLLKSEKLSTSQLSEMCGYQKTEIDHIHPQLAELESEGYFVIKFGKSSPRGRRPKIYAIKRDPVVITRIYENYPELERIIRTTDWILDEIIEDRFHVKDSEIKNEIKSMLQKSPHFFWLCISQLKIYDIIDQWNAINNVLLPNEDNESQKNADSKSLTFLKFYDFYAYCVFSDILNDENTTESWTYLQDIRQKMRDYHQDVTQNLQSYESMRVIMYTLSSIHNILMNEIAIDEYKPSLNQLNIEINHYLIFQERAKAVNTRDIELEREMIKIYEKIIKILG